VAVSRSSKSGTASAVNSTVNSRRVQEPTITLDPAQRSRLLVAKSRGLVASHLDIDPNGSDLRASSFLGGAIVRVDRSVWVLLDENGVSGLGAALALVGSDEVASLNVITDGEKAAGILARRSREFVDAPLVWKAEGRKLVIAEPAPMSVPSEPSAAERELIGMLRNAGVDVTVEHGEIRGEIRGLEIARVVTRNDGTRLEVGVGRHDREAFTMVHGNLPTAAALESVIASVESVRRVDAESHPLRRLAPEGWLRWRLLNEPSLVGALELQPAEPPVPRESVKDTGASIAVGVDANGGTVVVACSVGIDLDVVPTGADARVLHSPGARLVIVVPERDNHPVTRRLAGSLVRPAEVIGLAGDWRVGEVAQ